MTINQSTPTIRLAKVTDAKVMVNIIAQTFQLSCPPESDSQLQKIYIAKHFNEQILIELISSKEHQVFVAEVAGNVVGLAALVMIKGEEELSKIYVLPDQHGKGIAQSLFNAVHKAAQSNGISSMKLHVYAHNERAKHFYQKQGFEFEQETTFAMEGELHHDHIYRLVIK